MPARGAVRRGSKRSRSMPRTTREQGAAWAAARCGVGDRSTTSSAAPRSRATRRGAIVVIWDATTRRQTRLPDRHRSATRPLTGATCSQSGEVARRHYVDLSEPSSTVEGACASHARRLKPRVFDARRRDDVVRTSAGTTSISRLRARSSSSSPLSRGAARARVLVQVHRRQPVGQTPRTPGARARETRASRRVRRTVASDLAVRRRRQRPRRSSPIGHPLRRGLPVRGAGNAPASTASAEPSPCCGARTAEVLVARRAGLDRQAPSAVGAHAYAASRRLRRRAGSNETAETLPLHPSRVRTGDSEGVREEIDR